MTRLIFRTAIGLVFTALLTSSAAAGAEDSYLACQEANSTPPPCKGCPPWLVEKLRQKDVERIQRARQICDQIKRAEAQRIKAANEAVKQKELAEQAEVERRRQLDEQAKQAFRDLVKTQPVTLDTEIVPIAIGCPHASRNMYYHVINRGRDTVGVTVECNFTGADGKILSSVTATAYSQWNRSDPEKHLLGLDSGMGSACFPDIPNIASASCHLTHVDPTPIQPNDPAYVHPMGGYEEAIVCASPEVLAYTTNLEVKYHLFPSQKRGEKPAPPFWAPETLQWAGQHNCHMLPAGQRIDVHGDPIYWGGSACNHLGSCDVFMLCVGTPCEWIYRYDVEGSLR